MNDKSYFNVMSSEDVFIVSIYKPCNNEISIYVNEDLGTIKKCDIEELKTRILKTNKDLDVQKINIYNLDEKDKCIEAAKYFGFECIGNQWVYKLKHDISNIKCVNYRLGYNNLNYNLTLFLMFLNRCFLEGDKILIPSAKEMNRYSKEICSEIFKSNMPDRLRYDYVKTHKSDTLSVGDMILGITENPGKSLLNVYKRMLSTGLFIDVRLLNNKVDTSIERLAGLLGHKINNHYKSLIKEENAEKRLKNEILWHVTKVINIYRIASEKHCIQNLNLKQKILFNHPELVYMEKENSYEPDNGKIRPDRLTINSTAAQFAEKLLCPYGKLNDIKSVSYMYPSEEKAISTGITRRNVLEETRNYIKEVMEPMACSEDGIGIIKKLYEVMDYYESLENINFNSDLDGNKELDNYAKRISCPLMSMDGHASDCYVTFSIGGIHGCQYNQKLYKEDITRYKKGEIAEYPKLFVEDNKGGEVLNKRYSCTSSGICNHEDFKSYYPVLLIMMGAFYNKNLGYDRYEKLYNLKKEYERELLEKSLSKEEREELSVLRETTKLILNAASGAADKKSGDSPIKMNNRILSMRIIGQLFTWRIAQAHSIKGGRVVSTNTDGLYTKMDPIKNEIILKNESKNIGVEIKPEELYLVSKDANNRFEGIYVKPANRFLANSSKDLFIKNISGRYLAAYNGPTITKLLDHPAIIDWGLAEYLKWESLKNNRKFGDFKEEVCRYILNKEFNRQFTDRVSQLKMFQNIIVANPEKHIYIFGAEKPLINGSIETDCKRLQVMPHVNRVFNINPQVLPKDILDKIIYVGMTFVSCSKNIDSSPIATKIVRANDDKQALLSGYLSVKKIKGLDFDTPVIVDNEDVSCSIINTEWIDMDYYLDQIKKKYIKNWMYH